LRLVSREESCQSRWQRLRELNVLSRIHRHARRTLWNGLEVRIRKKQISIHGRDSAQNVSLNKLSNLSLADLPYDISGDFNTLSIILSFTLNQNSPRLLNQTSLVAANGIALKDEQLGKWTHQRTLATSRDERRAIISSATSSRCICTSSTSSLICSSSA